MGDRGHPRPRRYRPVRRTELKFQAIIFDFDGVIVDSEGLANAAMAEVLTGLGCRISGEEAVARYAGLRWRDCHRRIELDFGRSFDSEEDRKGTRLNYSQ